MQHAMPSDCALVEIPANLATAEWTWGTVVYRNDAGELIGYGHFARVKPTTVRVTARFGPEACALLSASRQLEGA